MKYIAFLLLLPIVASCQQKYFQGGDIQKAINTGQYGDKDDPEDICCWSLRTSCYVHNTFIGEEQPQKPDTIKQINIFVKRDNEIKWFHPGGVTTFYAILDSYNKDISWFNYACDGSDSTGKNVIGYRVMIDFSKKTVSITDWDYNHEIDYLP